MYIAYQQWRTNAARLRVELYDRRAGILRAAKKHLATALQRGDLAPDEVTEFAAAMADAPFLFDDEITVFLDTIVKRSIAVSARTEALRQLAAVGDAVRQGEMRQRQVDDLAWMEDQLRALNPLVKKYLKVQQ